MICVSLQNKTYAQLLDILGRDDVRMAEIRLDRCILDEGEIEELFAGSDVPLVATCRFDGCPDAESRLAAAIRAGAKYADLEMDAPAPVGKRLRRLAHECGTIFIRSYHNFETTPSYEELEQTVSTCQRFGAEVVKIVTTARTEADCDILAKLYDFDREGKLIAFCMGEAGRNSRFDCLRYGAPFTYACLEEDDCTAEGQWTVREMNDRLYGSRPFFDRENLQMPSSKSFAQRAIMAAALSEGTSVLHGMTFCDDCNAALAAMKALGASVRVAGDSVEISGIGDSSTAVSTVDAGESGLLARMLIPVLALRNEGLVKVEGTGTLLRRPLTDANDIMAAFGVTLTNVERQAKEVHVPLAINGKLLPGRAEVSGKGGSQLISGLLMALPMADKNSTLYVMDPKSIPYMFITLDVLRKFGIDIVNEMEGGDDFLETEDWAYCTGMTFRIRGGQRYSAAEIDLEKDWSAAANLMVAGAIFGKVSLEGLDTASLQADLSIMDILVEAGASISQDDDGGTTGTLNVCKAPLNAFSVDLGNSPDLFPIVSVLAAFCPGTSRIAGAGRLAGKESNRADSILEMLSGMKVKASMEGDEMVIEGHSLERRLACGELLETGAFSSHHDHRMVMALEVAGLGAEGKIEIDDTQCVSKSFPGFYSSFEQYKRQ